MPVLIGWAAVTGTLGLGAVVLFAVIFFWTPPHFWALAMRFRDDYARAGVPMLPVVASRAVGGPADRRLHLGDRRRSRCCSGRWPRLRVAGSTPPAPRAWAAGSLARGAPAARRIQRDADTRPMQLFHVSISYMALLSIAIIVDVLV